MEADGRLAGDVEASDRPDFDTNMDILPSRREKKPAEPAAEKEEKSMSKRKKKKLEQLAEKHRRKEMRGEVLKELKTLQLTTEQSQVLRASQSVHMTRRAQVEAVKQRLAMKLPLTAEMKRLLPKRKKPEEEGAEEEQDEAAGDYKPVGVPVVERARLLAKAEAARAKQVAAKVAAEEAAARQAELADDGEGAAASAAAPEAPTDAEKVPQRVEPRQPVRVRRTAEIEEQRAKLPAVMVEQEVVEAVLQNDVSLVCGDTGCGKSTQVPQFLYEAGVCDGARYRIGVTQPRRVAAISVSQRVGQELNNPDIVGYQVRYDRSHCHADTRIKFMTDGILLREIQSDFLLKQYAAIVVDEAHERSVNCDILIGLLSRAAQKRRAEFNEASPDSDVAPPLRIIIMSATLRHTDFTENRQLFATPPPVIPIDARTFPVTVHFARKTEQDYIKAAQKTVLKIHKSLPPGSILVFVTGRQEVSRLCGLLRKTMLQQAKAKAKGELAGYGGDEGEEGDEEGEEEQEGELQMLEGSEDGDEGYDDDLDGGGPQPTDASQAAEEGWNGTATSAEQGATKRNLGSARSKRKRRKGSAAEATVAAEEGAAVQAASAKRRKKGKKGKKGQAETPVEGVTEEAGTDDVAMDGEDKPAPDEELDINFQLDDEEDTVQLDSSPVATDSQTASAASEEEKREKRVRMNRLDKSRTAGGAFTGAGFGEAPLKILPLYAQLPAREQLAAFSKPGENERIVVVATNVAETSVTLPNVRYIVDTGREKRRKYRAASGVSSFVVDKVSKASANQRAGRAGRIGPGHAYRLFSAAAFENYFHAFAPIALLATPMDPVMLLLASLGIPRLDLFPWPTPPSAEAVHAALRRLRALGALEEDHEATVARFTALLPTKSNVRCTPLGYSLAAVPVAPRYAKMLLEAVTASQAEGSFELLGHMCALVAALSVGNLTSLESLDGSAVESLETAGGADSRKKGPRWMQLRDDADGLMWLLGGYAWAVSQSEEEAENFCIKARANSRQVGEAHSLMQQLACLMKKRLEAKNLVFDLDLPLRPKPPNPVQAQKLRDCLVEGLLDRIAVSFPDGGRHAYVCGDVGQGKPVFVHNSSNVSRYRPLPSMLVFNEIISTSRPFMRDCITLDPIFLSRRASKGQCSLLKLGDFLPMPAPRYLKEQDSVMGFASPVYTPLDHPLPTVEVNVPRDTIFLYKVFAKALLEGEVFEGVPTPKASLLARPSIILHSPNNPRVMGLVNPLWEKRVGSRAELIDRWQQDPRFLLDGYLKWLPAAAHREVMAAWPPTAAASSKDTSR